MCLKILFMSTNITLLNLDLNVTVFTPSQSSHILILLLHILRKKLSNIMLGVTIIIKSRLNTFSFLRKWNKKAIGILNYDKTFFLHVVFLYALPFCLHALKT